MKCTAFCLFLLAICTTTALSERVGPPGEVDAINKYSDFKSFGSVLLRCPIKKVWPTVGNAATWFPAVIGDSLLNITIVSGTGRNLQSKFNYFVQTSPTSPVGRTQQRLIKLSDFDFELITTFDSSTLPLSPWTTRVTLDRVTYTNRVVEFTLVSFGQTGVINVPPEMQDQVQRAVQGFFVDVFAPSLKAMFDRCK